MTSHRQRPAFVEAEGGVPEGLTLEDRARLFLDHVPAARALPPVGPGLLVALDIDGTILGHDGTLSPAVHDAIRELQRRGARVVPATGRSTYATLPVALMLDLDPTWVVCSNGAMIGRFEEDGGAGESERVATDASAYEDATDEPEYDAGHAERSRDIMAGIGGATEAGRAMRIEVTDRHTFDARSALRTLRGELPGAMYAVESDSGFKVNRPFPPGELTADVRIVPFEELWSEPVSRLTLREPHLDAQDFHDLVERVGLHGVGYAVGWTAWLDISPEGISKATALEEVRARLGVAQGATVAIGDGFNDIEMVDWAGCGVAMGNASQPLRDVADGVTGTVADDGAAVVLRALLLER